MKRIGLLIALALCLPSLAEAATLSLSRTTRTVTAEEIADGAPMGGYVHEFFVNSDTDLLAVGADHAFGASFFHHTLGSDLAPPSPEDLPGRPSLGVDTFITLPGETLRLGGAFSSAPGERGWGDLSNDGPQQNFMFARFTTAGQTASFTGNIFARGYDAPVQLPFSYVLPGNESDLALLDAEPNYSMEYSLDPPPAPTPPPVVPENVPTTPSVPEPLPAPPEAPLVDMPPPIDPPVAEQPPVVDLPATPAEPEGAPPESPVHVILPGFQVDLIHDLEITPIQIGWGNYWHYTSDLLNPTLIDLTTFDGGTRITDAASLIDLTSVVTTGEVGEVILTSFNADHRLFAFGGADLASATAASSQIPEPSTTLLAVAALLTLSTVRRR